MCRVWDETRPSKTGPNFRPRPISRTTTQSQSKGDRDRAMISSYSDTFTSSPLLTWQLLSRSKSLNLFSNFNHEDISWTFFLFLWSRAAKVKKQSGTSVTCWSTHRERINECVSALSCEPGCSERVSQLLITYMCTSVFPTVGMAPTDLTTWPIT